MQQHSKRIVKLALVAIIVVGLFGGAIIYHVMQYRIAQECDPAAADMLPPSPTERVPRGSSVHVRNPS